MLLAWTRLHSIGLSIWWGGLDSTIIPAHISVEEKLLIHIQVCRGWTNRDIAQRFQHSGFTISKIVIYGHIYDGGFNYWSIPETVNHEQGESSTLLTKNAWFSFVFDIFLVSQKAPLCPDLVPQLLRTGFVVTAAAAPSTTTPRPVTVSSPWLGARPWHTPMLLYCAVPSDVSVVCIRHWVKIGRVVPFNFHHGWTCEERSTFFVKLFGDK